MVAASSCAARIRLGQSPHFGKSTVEARNPAGIIDNENTVGGGLERRGEHRQCLAQLQFGGEPCCDVVSGDHEPTDGRIIEQIDQ